MKTFYFNTGVERMNGVTSWNGVKPVPLCKGQVWRGGVKQIPFDCDDVPDNATFMFACDDSALKESKLEGIIVREIFNSSLVSKFAYFKTNT